MNRKAKTKLSLAILILFSIIFISLSSVGVLASRTINNVKLNGGSSVTVEPSDSISVSVTVTTSGSDDNWESTKYQIGLATAVCRDTPDHTSDGTYTESFLINAPASVGTYDFKVWVYSNDGCSSGLTGPTTLTSGINVVPPCTIIVDSPTPDSVASGTTDIEFTASNCGDVFDIFHSQNGAGFPGGNIGNIADDATITDGTYSWDTLSTASGTNYKVKVCKANNLAKCDESNKFSIINVGSVDLSNYYDKDEVDAMIAGLNSDISSLELRMTAAEGDIDSLQSALAIAQSDIDALESQMADAQAAIDALETAMDDANADIATLQTQMADAQDAIAELQSRMDNAEGDIADLQSRMSVAESDIATFQSAMSSMNTEITELGIAVDELYANDLILQTDVSDLQGRMATAEFDIDSLEGRMGSAEVDIDSLELRMDTAEADIDSLETRVADLELRMSNAEAAISDLQSRMATAEFDIDSLEINLANTESTVIDLQLRMSSAEFAITDIQSQITTLQNEVSDLQTRMDNGESDIDDLQTRMTVAESAITDLQSRMATAESTLTDLQSRMSTAEAVITDIQSQITSINSNIESLWSSINSLEIGVAALQTAVSGLELRMTDAEDRVISLEERMSSAESDIDILELRMDTAETNITELQSRVTTLENKLNAMNHGTINLKYNNGDHSEHPNTLRVWGEAPYGAKKVKVLLLLPNGGTAFDSGKFSITTLGTNQKSYEYFIDLSEIARVEYNVVVKFYDSSGDLMDGYNVGAIFDELLNYGIENLIVSSRVETFYNPNVQVPITYSVRVDKTIPYAVIGVISTEGSDVEFGQVLREQTLFAGDLYTFSDKLYFSELGYYDLVIEILDYYGEGEYDVAEISTNFNVELVDFANEMPDSSIYVTQPIPNNNDVYWHSMVLNDNFDMAMTLIEGTPIVSCNWVVQKEGQNDEDGYMQIVTDEGQVKTCVEKLYKGNIFTSEGIYTLTGIAHFTGPTQTGKTYLEGNVLIGVDNTPPIINSVAPQAGAYSGEVLVTVNATDALSGIGEVWVTVTDKADLGINFALQAYNPETGLYEATFDTIAMQIPDGRYDITSVVYDIAGNSNSVTVDPIIDNTAPVVDIVDKNFADIIYQGNLVYVKARILESLAGLDDAAVILRLGYGEGEEKTCSMIKVSGDDYDSIYETEPDCFAPFFNGETNVEKTTTVMVEAQDKAIPSNIGSASVFAAILDNVADVSSDGSCVGGGCITLENMIQDSDGNEVLTFKNNNDASDHNATVTIATEDGGVAFTFDIPAGGERKVYVTNDFFISPEEADITSVTYDSGNKELKFTADGTGTQEVLIYINGYGVPTSVSFSPGTLTSWSYDSVTNVVTAVVTYGSPHQMIVSWYTAPLAVAGGGGGGCITTWTCTAWSDCIDGTQTRTCNKAIPYCSPTNEKPAESQSCTVTAPTPTAGEGKEEETLTPTAPAPITSLTGITGAVVRTFRNIYKNRVISFAVLFALVLLVSYLITAKKKRSGKLK